MQKALFTVEREADSRRQEAAVLQLQLEQAAKDGEGYKKQAKEVQIQLELIGEAMEQV